MKKILSMILALSLVLSLAACGGNTAEPTTEATEPATEATEPATEAAVSVEATCEELVNSIIEKQPVEFMGGIMPVDLTDTSEDGLWAIKYFTGLQDASQITEVSVFEPMMGSVAFSMVMVRVAPEAGTKTVAENMKNGIDTRKWICVGADDVLVAGYADMVMLIMLDTGLGLTAQSFVDAFASTLGAEPEFVI